MEYIGIIEGILFIVGDEGISFNKLSEIIEIEDKKLLEALEILKKNYENEVRGFRLEVLGNKYKLVTKKEHVKFFEKLIEKERDEKLSQSGLETLAIIAYNSPITRLAVDEIRGVDSVYQIKKLLYKQLVREAGRSELPGRPILYEVTDKFLDYLGLETMDQLPNLIENESDDNEEINLYDSRYRE